MAPPPCSFDPGHAARAPITMSSADEKMSKGVPAELVFPGEHPDRVDLQRWLEAADAEIQEMYERGFLY